MKSLLKKVGVVIVVLFIIGILFGSDSEYSEETENVLFTGSPNSLTPTRNEIDTKFTTETNEAFNLKSNYYPRYQREGLETVGFQEGTGMSIEYFDGSSIDIGSIVILKFDTTENAKQFHLGLIEMVKNEGGYKEQSTSGIKANCFSTESGNSAIGYARTSFCQKSNVHFYTEMASFKTSRLSPYKDWAKTISNKF